MGGEHNFEDYDDEDAIIHALRSGSSSEVQESPLSASGGDDDHHNLTTTTTTSSTVVIDEEHETLTLSADPTAQIETEQEVVIAEQVPVTELDSNTTVEDESNKAFLLSSSSSFGTINTTTDSNVNSAAPSLAADSDSDSDNNDDDLKSKSKKKAKEIKSWVSTHAVSMSEKLMGKVEHRAAAVGSKMDKVTHKAVEKFESSNIKSRLLNFSSNLEEKSKKLEGNLKKFGSKVDAKVRSWDFGSVGHSNQMENNAAVSRHRSISVPDSIDDAEDGFVMITENQNNNNTVESPAAALGDQSFVSIQLTPPSPKPELS